MILLDRPYVSKHFLNYLERSGQPVLETPFTAGLARDYGLNLVDDAEAEKRCRNGERLYTSSENALEWIHAHLGDMPVARHIDAMKDKAALRRVFDNVIGNAARYSDGDLSVVLAPDGEIRIENSAANLTAVQAARLFDRFYTVNSARGGTGLGLSIAKGLTEKMGGEIGADVRAGRLCVRIRFP